MIYFSFYRIVYFIFITAHFCISLDVTGSSSSVTLAGIDRNGRSMEVNGDRLHAVTLRSF